MNKEHNSKNRGHIRAGNAKTLPINILFSERRRLKETAKNKKKENIGKLLLFLIFPKTPMEMEKKIESCSDILTHSPCIVYMYSEH